MLEYLSTTVPGSIVRDLAATLDARALRQTVATLPGAELRRLVDLLPPEVPRCRAKRPSNVQDQSATSNKLFRET